MKKIFTLAIVLVLALAVFASCSSAPNNGDMYYPEVDSADSSLQAPGGENYEYDTIIENDFVSTEEKTDSYFSLDRNTASYAIMRKQIMSGLTVSANSVRLEEYVNYFNYNYTRPTQGEALAVDGAIFDTPYNANTKLFTISVAAEQMQFDSKPNNIVFLIDTSGSMYGADRLGLIQQAFTMMLDYLGDDDSVSIVTYASGVSLALEGAKGKDKTHIANVLQDLQASGSTNGAGGIQRAYEMAEKYFVEGGNNRVLLATDGDFNVGISNKEQLKDFVSEKRDSGIYLSVLGVGMFNTNDSIMNTLATNGNGNYAYLDSVSEAYKVLVKELNGTVNTVAKDAKIGVKFNKEVVQNYRLLGYESKMMSAEDFENEKKDAGEIGSGHTVTAVYEITLKEGVLTDPSLQVATAQINYKVPDNDQDATNDKSNSITKVFTIANYTTTPNDDCKFISCVVEFALVLRKSEYKADASLANVSERLHAIQTLNDDQFKAEFLQIVTKALSSEKYQD